MDILIGLAITFVAQLIYGIGEMASKQTPPAEAAPVYEVRTATDEEIERAAAELPELLRRAEEAAQR